MERAILEILRLLKRMSVVGYPKVRLGANSDGGYVLLDNFPPRCTCLSVGVGAEASFDLALAARGVTILQFDHTIEQAPCDAENIRFEPLGLGANSDCAQKLLSLSDMIRKALALNPSKLTAKIDAEGSEWPALAVAALNDLARFDQLVIEFHGLLGLGEQEFQNVVRRSLANLRATHLPFHVHGNNWGRYEIVRGIPIPDVLEVSYARKGDYQFQEAKQTFPTTLDFPNHPERPDLYLGTFDF